MISDDEIKVRGIDTLTALQWCKEREAVAEFFRDGSVSVHYAGKEYQRKSLLEAILAHVNEARG